MVANNTALLSKASTELGAHEEVDSSTAKATDIIAPSEEEVALDKLANQEQRLEEIENRTQRIGNDHFAQRSDLQKNMFWIAIVFIAVFYICFLLTVMSLAWSHDLVKREFPVTATILIGMTGSIPTILSGFMMVGLFSAKDNTKEKDEKSTSPDVSTIAKVLFELAKLKTHH